MLAPPAIFRPLAAMERQVLWRDGPLGLTLRPDLGEDLPPVVGRLTRPDSPAALAGVAVGDQLVSINGVDTAGQGYDHIVALLQSAERPATLRFRAPQGVASGHTPPAPDSSNSSALLTKTAGGLLVEPPGKDEQYTVVWADGPLGLMLKPGDDEVGVPSIRKITGKGASAGLERAVVGDLLVAVNGQETTSLGFRGAVSLLKTVEKPVVLAFKRLRLRRRSSCDGAYDIVWHDGELGLKFKPGRCDVPVIGKLTHKGITTGLENANAGDELVSVNGVLVEGQAYGETLGRIKDSDKPAVLRFRPRRDRELSSQSPSGARRQKKRIPLRLAKEIVAASQGVQLESARFAGLPILAIEEDSDEARLLRIEAKACIAAKSDQSSGGFTPTGVLLRAEDAAQVLQEALERVKRQAEVYEAALEAQRREEALKSATQSKSSDVVARHNHLLDELADAIAGLERGSDDEEEADGVMGDLQSVMNIPVVVPSTKYCAECGATEKETSLARDGDGQCYCTDCWENILRVTRENGHGLLTDTPSTDGFLTATAIDSHSASSIWLDPLVLKLRLNIEDLQVSDRCFPPIESSENSTMTEVYRGNYSSTSIAIKRLAGPCKTVGYAAALATVCKTLGALKHPNLLPLIGLTWTKALDLQVITPWVSGGDLRALLDKEEAESLTWEDFKCGVAIDIASALHHIHDNGFISTGIGAVTSRNVLLDRESGAAFLNLMQLPCADLSDAQDRVPSPVPWVAPELVLGGAPTTKSDVYSFGVLLTELDTTMRPFHDAMNPNGVPMDDMLIASHVARGLMRPTLSPECPTGIAQLVDKCLAQDPETRPMAHQLVYELRSILKGEL